jgi:hypothetical protein
VLTADFDGSFKLKKNRLIDENVTGLDAKSADLLLGQVDLLSWSAPTLQSV